MSVSEDGKPAQPTVSKRVQKNLEKKAKVIQEKAADRKRRLLHEKLRTMGRVIPSRDDMDYERELQIIATKGVVQLFNAVAEFQADLTKEAVREDREKKQRTAKMIASVGSDKKVGGANFNNLIEKINSTQRKWKVLEDDEDGQDAEEIDAGRGLRISHE